MRIWGQRQVFAFIETFHGNFTLRTTTRHITGPPACSKAPLATR
ncbi:hypothetical protein ACFPZI_31370 [Streptomyces chlorus]|uniref:Uncharacterized protein n=1 Tax=Streptomyces chlorus TaxID=887452 RepID=A0ABW1E6P8_9ACTN